MRDSTEPSNNPLVRALMRGETALCMPIRFSRLAQVARMAAAARLNAVYMDMEHSTIGLEQVSQLALALDSEGVTPLVRVATHEPHDILSVLEGGAGGVIVPHVHNPAQARAVVEAARFAPLGRRAMAGASAALRYARLPAEQAGHTLNADTLVVVMVESVDGVGNADAIAAVPGVDLLLVGTGDLSDEMGIHGQAEHPKIRLAFETVAAACRKHGKWLGVAGMKGNTPMLADLHRMGARFLSVKTDETLLLDAMQAETVRMRQLFGDADSVKIA